MSDQQAVLKSEQMHQAAPFTFTRSVRAIWGMTKTDTTPKWLTVPVAVVAVAFAWTFILAWYVFFGIFIIPYRLIRRSQRNRKIADQRHKELLEATRRQP